MAKYRRVTWTTILFVALLAPLVVTFVFSILLPDKRGTSASASTAPATAAAPFGFDARLLAGGDGRTLWLIEPMNASDRDTPVAGYQILQRTSNTGVWQQVSIDDEVRFTGFPRAMAVIGDGAPSGGTALVITKNDMEAFTRETMHPAEGLPSGHEFLATCGSEDAAYALTRGVPPAATTRPGDRLSMFSIDTQPATAPSTAPSTAPATQTAMPGPALINAYVYRTGHWSMLPSLGEVGQTVWHLTPPVGAHVALAAQRGRIFALWVDPAKPMELITRSLEDNSPAWSQPVITQLPERVPANTHLLTVTLDQTIYVFWPVATGPSGVNLTLHGGRLVTHMNDPADLTLPRENLWRPIVLLPSGEDVKPTADIALAPAENSLAVLISGKNGDLYCAIYNRQGQEISGSARVDVQAPPRRIQVVQNGALLALLALSALALWQWRLRPDSVTLPSDLGPAPLYLRGIGFGIDFGLALLITAATYGMWDSSAWQIVFNLWANAFAQPEDLLNSPPLLMLMGIYLGHVTLGELFFRRSIGKMITGMQVLMTDGRSPTIAAVLLRNFMRILEMIPGVLTVWVLISMYRQRLGDVLAGTIVVSPHRTETPDDPDAEEKGVTRVKQDKNKTS